MECHEGATMIKTFRGLLGDGGADTIVLHTNDGSTGYRIVKFQVIPYAPGTAEVETVTKVYKVETAGSATVDFSDQTLLGAAYYQDNASQTYVNSETIIFDREIFNQDIHLTTYATSGSSPMNYYIELEQVKLDLSESTVATLKDIRNEKRIPPG